MTALATYLAAHWVLVIVAVLAVTVLGIAAYVFKNMKFALAALAVALAGFMFQGVTMHGINIQLQKDLAEQVEIANGRLTALNTISLKDAFQAKKDSDANDALERMASDTPKNDGPCLAADSAHRVWAVREAIARETAVPASGISNVLSRSNRNAR